MRSNSTRLGVSLDCKMSTKSQQLYELMLRKGYPGEFSRLICSEMHTDFTAERMISYISRENHRLEDIADEMLSIRDLRDRIINKRIYEHTQSNINKHYNRLREIDE